MSVIRNKILTTPKIEQMFGRKMYALDKGKLQENLQCSDMHQNLQKSFKYLK